MVYVRGRDTFGFNERTKQLAVLGTVLHRIRVQQATLTKRRQMRWRGLPNARLLPEREHIKKWLIK